MLSGPASEMWDENVWGRLLDYVEDRSVIPIVGPDLLEVEEDGKTFLLERYIAHRLARDNNLDETNLAGGRPLNDVVRRLLNRPKTRWELCGEISQIVKNASFGTPKALKQLAEITDFNLFVSITFDSLLEKAIDEVRYPGRQGVQCLSFSTKKTDDLQSGKNELNWPTVFHLMGKVGKSGNFVISDADMLDYMGVLQSGNPKRRPELLFDELKRNHLLILGAGFSDWLARLFLWTARGGVLWARPEIFEVLADDKTHGDPELIAFLRHHSTPTRVYFPGGAVDFVDTLWRKWRERHPEPTPAVGKPIFISYARKDIVAAKRLKADLEAYNLKVWLDTNELTAGDKYEARIKRLIKKDCGCFLPTISLTTEARLEGFFRREWNWAVERGEGFFDLKEFIAPVCIDDIPDPKAIPPEFGELHMVWLPGGRVTPEFAEKLRRIVTGSYEVDRPRG